MATVTNVTPRTPLGIGGKLIEPGKADEVDLREDTLRKHRFVQAGWLVVGDATPKKAPAPKSNASQIVEQIKDETDRERLESLTRDSRKTVANAATARLQTLANEDPDGEGDDGDVSEDPDGDE